MRVMITGGTGTLGTELVRHILAFKRAERLVIYSRDEQKQNDLEQALIRDDHSLDPVRFFVGDVRDPGRLAMALRGIDTVIHTAALKIVPKCEYDPLEAIKTNVYGTQNLVEACLNPESSVKRVLLVSTDKAVEPINLYGATKLCAERLVLAANNITGSFGAAFSVLRYGNVANSRGSVIPIFRDCRNRGSAYPITDPKMTRFWLRIEEARRLVFDALDYMKGGEVFVPILPAFSVFQLIQAIDHGGDPPLRLIGTRPGEKVHETLATSEELTRSRLLYPGLLMIHPNEEKSEGATLYPRGYRSNTTNDQLTLEGLKHELEKIP